MRSRVLIVTCAAAMAIACGKSPEQKQLDELQTNAEQMQKGAESFAKNMENMAKGIQGATDAGGKPVDPVSFHDLQAAFGELGGWQKGKPTGERMSTPVNYSEAKVTYTKGEAEIEAQISDSALNQMLLVPFSMFLSANYEKENENGYEKSTTIGEYPGLEKWDGGDKSGELTAIVNKRFIVQLDGRHLDDPKALRTAMAAIDLKKLAALK